jgi:DNA-binding NtrC family response regulator
VIHSKILLIGRATDETNNLRRELRRQEVYDVNVATTSEQALTAIANEKINLLIFNTEILTRKKLQMTGEVRDLGQKKFPVLILANSIMADTLEELEQSKSTVFLEKPFEVKDFFGVTEKLVSKRDVSQRIFRRFQTNQEGNFSKSPALDVTTTVRIRNLSQGGAYFEYDGRQNVHTGDQIFLEIPLSQVQKEYKMRARVVWTTPPTATGRNGLGVEFIR